ncbi:MAG: PDZ domain-containing protein [Armatimonadetes bacterium]|nr:PDZ domain-containing protein [Armatimonadota bacterium]
MAGTNRSFWVVAVLVLVVAGLAAGYGLRARYESNRGVGMPSSLFAVRTGSDQAGADIFIGDGTAAEYFDRVLRLLQEEFVDPIDDEAPLARGALRSLFQWLRDPGTRYYNPDEWSAYLNVYEGKFSGIGADVTVLRGGTEERIYLPLTVVSVADGGPAAEAGLKAGDIIEGIDGRWVASWYLLDEWDDANLRLGRGEITAEELEQIRSGIQDRVERMSPLSDALEALVRESAGEVLLRINRDGEQSEIAVERRPHSVEPVEETAEGIRIRSFGSGAAQRLRAALEGKDEVTLDLRGNPGGSLETVERCLSLLIPAGEYARVQREPGEKPAPLRLEEGTDRRLRIKVMVDRGTAREAELFVAALRDRGGAEIVGGRTFGLGLKVERFALSDGGGYTITSGRFYDLEGRSLFEDRAEPDAEGEPQ